MTTPDDSPSYTRLELTDQLRIAADLLRSTEEEHYRGFLNKKIGRPDVAQGGPTEEHLEKLRAHFKTLQDRHGQS